MSERRRWWALTAVTAGTFMTSLDNNVVNVALPTIQRELGLSISGLEWVTSSYILLFAGLMLVGGRLADVLGTRRVFSVGLVVFSLASLGAGLSPDSGTLIAARAIQGLGAAMLTPTALGLLPVIFKDPRERGAAVGVWSATGALAMALGPLAGGFISQTWHWGWIFLINVPIGAAALALALWAVPPTPARARYSLDLPGLVTSTLALSALTYALIEGAGRGWTSPEILAAFGMALAAAVTFVAIEARAAEPMIDLSLFRSRIYSGGVLAIGLWSFGVFGVYFFSALWLQNVLGFTPTQAGAAFVPLALVMAVVALVAQRIAGRIGAAGSAALGLGLMAVAVFGLSLIGQDGTYPDILPWFLLYGVGSGLLVPLTAAIIGAMPDRRSGVASGVLNVSREVFGLLGVTVLGAILGSHRSAALAAGTPPLTAFLDSYRLTLIIGAAIVLVGVPVSLFSLRDRTARQAQGHPSEEPVRAG